MKKLEKISNIINRFKDLTALGIANITATAIGGIFWFFVASLIGETYYGQVSYIIAIASIAGVFSTLGSSNTIIVFTAKGEKILAHVSLLVISSSIVASIIVFFILHDLGAGLYVLGYAIFSLTTAEILGKKMYQDYSKYTITQRILMAGLGVAFYYILGYQGIILGISLSFFPYLIRLFRGFRELKIDFSVLKSKRNFILNSYALDLSRMFSGSTDKLIIAPMFGFAVLGNYQLGIQFFTLLTLIPSAAYQYILPQDASGQSNIKLKKILIIISIVIAVLGIFLSPIILPEFFPKFSKAIQVTQIISIAVIPFTINAIFISKFLGSLKNRIVLIGSLIYIIALVSGIVFLGKPFGIKGVAAGYVLGITAEAVYMIVANKLINKPIEKTAKNEESFKKEFDFLIKNSWLFLLIIGIVAILLRLYFLPKSLPLTLDALNYFWYANDISILGHLPNWPIDHNGWPAFLSVFFSAFHLHNFLDYMNLQRVVTIMISTLTIIPVYLLCKRFLGRSYALLGAALFAFEPRIIQNSVLGITDPLYIFLVTLSIVMFLSKDKRIVFASFAIAALATLIRTEGLALFLVLSIMFFVREKKERKIIAKYALAVIIFTLVLLPMVELRLETSGHDYLTGRVTGEIGSISSQSENNSKSNIVVYFIKGLENPIKFLGWSMIPIWLFFVPVGAYLIFKKRNPDTLTIIVGIIVISIPAFYALSKFSDTRYLYPLYPLFCVLAIFAAKSYLSKFKNPRLLLVLLTGGILIASIGFTSFKSTDIVHEKESLSLAYYVDNMTSGINPYMPESKYLPIPEISKQNFPILSTMVPTSPKIIPTDGFLTIDDYIAKNKDQGLTNLVLDGSNNSPEFLNDVFFHEEKYPYLEKIFDSTEHGYKYHLKIFRINYNKFESLKTS